MIEVPFNPETMYVDERGYARYWADCKLVHRTIAKVFIYKNYKFPGSFFQYVVHHKDRDKLNNNPSNLEILTKEEHAKIHGIAVPIPDPNEVPF